MYWRKPGWYGIIYDDLHFRYYHRFSYIGLYLSCIALYADRFQAIPVTNIWLQNNDICQSNLFLYIPHRNCHWYRAFSDLYGHIFLYIRPLLLLMISKSWKNRYNVTGLQPCHVENTKKSEKKRKDNGHLYWKEMPTKGNSPCHIEKKRKRKRLWRAQALVAIASCCIKRREKKGQ